MNGPPRGTQPRRFQAPLVVDPAVPDGYMKHHVALPESLARELAAAGVTHVEGRIAGTSFRRSLHPTPAGGLCLRFGVSWLRDAGLTPGTMVDVEIAADPDPDRVDVPDELAAVFEADPAAEHLWSGLTPGRQRTLVYGILRARRSETRARRAEALVTHLRHEFGVT